MKIYKNLRLKRQMQFFILFCKINKNFEEHLWVINKFNEKLRKTMIKKFNFYIMLDFFEN